MRNSTNWLWYLVVGALAFIVGALIVGIGVGSRSYSLVVLGLVIIATGMTGLDVSYLHHGTVK